MKRIITPLISVLAGTLSGALVAFVQHRRLRERMSYYERKVNRLEQDILNIRLWMKNDHP